MTLILDDFDGASPDLTWTALKEVAVGVITTGGRGTTNAGFATAIHRPDGDVGSTDMFAECDLPAAFADDDRTVGVMTRVGTGSTATGYALQLNDQNNRYELVKYAANVATTITGFVATAVAPPTRMRLESEGTSHRIYIGTWTDEASKPAPVATHTDATITSGSRTGITTYNSGNVLRFDNFRAGALSDLVAGTPVVGAGADVAAHPVSTAFTRTATESGSGISSRAWTIQSGPAGVGTTIGTAAALSWSPATAGTYVLRYAATNPSGTGTDDMQIVVTSGGATGHPTVRSGQAVTGAIPTGTSSGAVALAAPALAGNLLVVALAGDKNTGTLTVTDNTTDPDPWTVEVSLPSTSISLYQAWRVAEGGEQTITVTTSGSNVSGGSFRVLELEQDGTAAWAALVKASTITTEATVTTSTTGTTAAAPFNGLGLASMAVDSASSVLGGSWSGSYTTDYDTPSTGLSGTSNGCGAIHTATKPIDAATTTTSTWTNSGGGADQQSAAVVVYGRAGAAGTLTQAWLGVDAVAVKTSGTGTARVAYSTSSGMTSPVYSGSLQTPDAQGITKHAVPAGLAPDTAHWYQVELAGTLIGTAQPFRTLPAAGAQESFAFAFASCRSHVDNSPSPNPTALADAVTRGIDLFLQIGDFHYRDIGTNDQALFRAGYDELFTRSNIAALLKGTPTTYVWSDHDFGGNDSNGSSPARPAAQSVYRERAPHPTLPSVTGGVYHTFVIGRVRFVVLDTRSYRSASNATDNSSKTMLGTEQKAWLQNLLDAGATTPVTVLITAEPWIADATGDDHWGKYQTERTVVAGWISAARTAGRTSAIFLSGDAHMLASDDGTNSPGGAPVYHGAALNQFTSTKGGPYSGGTRASTNAYGRVVVADTGSQIALTYSGYYDGGTLWATHTATVPTPNAQPGAFLPFFAA